MYVFANHFEFRACGSTTIRLCWHVGAGRHEVTFREGISSDPAPPAQTGP